MERPKVMDPEEERRRRERRRREREARHRDGKSRDGKSSRSKKANYHMDIIDKLDVTSIYGTGSELSLSIGLNAYANLFQCFITTDRSMPVTLTGTARACAQHQCKHSPKIPLTWPWVVPVL